MIKYKLTDEQKLKLNEIAETFVHKIEDELAYDVGGILDPYCTEGALYGTKDYSKLTEMVLYIGHYISACSYD
jgi:hypothetical protein